ncbi:MAG: PqqD family protein [Thermoplasmatota archaeon]
MRKKEKLMDSPTYRGPDPRFIFPVRSEVDWFYREKMIVLEYPKNFNRMEKGLHRLLKGPENIKRPLDEVGTLLWEMCDGEHCLAEIYYEQQERFHERVEPVDKVVGGLLEAMLGLGLMRLEYRNEGEKGSKRKARKVVVRAVSK